MKLNKRTILYLVIGYLNVLLNVLTSLLLMKYLSVAEMGKVTIGKSVFQSFDTSHLGTRNGFDRIFPHINDDEKLSSIFTVGFIITFLASFGYIVFWLCFKDTRSAYYFLFAFSGMIYALVSLYKIYFRCFDDKSKFISLSFWVLFFPTLVQLLFFFIWGVWGIAIALLFAYISVAIIIQFKYNIRFIFKMNELKPIARLLFSKGFLVYLSAIIIYISTIGDRFFIQRYWGLESVGLLAIVMFFFTVISMFSSYYTEMYMSQIIKNRSLKYTLKHIFIVVILTILIVLVSYFIIPLVLQYLMPKYLSYMVLINICIWGAVPFSMTPLINIYYQAVDRKVSLFILRLLLTTIYLCLLIYILKNNEKGDVIHILYLKNAFLLFTSLISLLVAAILTRVKK